MKEFLPLLLTNSATTCYINGKHFPAFALHASPELYEQSYFIHRRGYWIRDVGAVEIADIEKGVYMAHSSTVALCIPLAMYLGFQEIYLIGCDCDYNLHRAPDASLAHFYPQSALPIRAQKKLQCDAATLPIRLEQLTLEHAHIKRCCDQLEVKIYNAGYGGKLEVYERREFASIF
jgi:hypothetical protein